MQIGESIGFIFRDRRWIVKMLIFAVLFLIPIIGWLAIAGYTLRVVRNVITGEQPALPEWENFGQLMVDGVKVWIVGIIWGIPTWILQGINSGVDSAILSFIIWLIGIVISLFQLSAIGGLAQSGNLADALNRRVIDRVQANPGAYIMVVIATAIFGIVAMVGLIGLVIGVLFTIAIAVTAGAHLNGQAFRLAEGRGQVFQPRF